MSSQPVTPRYDISPLFVLRLTGFPIEILHQLRAPELAALLEKTVSPGADEKALQPQLEQTYATAIEDVRTRLWAWVANERFRHVLLFSSPMLESHLHKEPIPPRKRNVDARKKESPWVAYMQRLATKTDTISFFGPSAWGRSVPELNEPMRVELASPDVSRRTVYVERWACEALAESIAADAEVRPLLRARVNDDVLVDGAVARKLRTNEAVELSDAERQTLSRCEQRPRLGELDSATVDALAAKGLITLGIAVPISATPLSLLEVEVASWPDGAAKTRWAGHLSRLREAAARMASSGELEHQRAALAEVQAALAEAGSSTTRDSKALYASRLPVNEDCERAVRTLQLGAPLIEQITSDLAPWYELWRDMAGLFRTRIAARIEPIWREAGNGGPVPLATLLGALERKNLGLARSGGVGLANEVDGELQSAWQEQLGERMKQVEVQLTADDLSFIRRRFEFQRMKSWDWPAPDITVAAVDAKAVERGDYTVVLSEIHPGFSPWLEAFMPWCPNPAALADFVKDGLGSALELSRSGLYDGPVHVLTRAPDFVPGWTFTGGLAMAKQREVRSAHVQVELVDGDFVAKGPDGKILGSLLDHWLVAMNTHRLELIGTGPVSPRLRVGRAVVQRRSWLVQPEDAVRPGFDTLGLPKLVAVQRVRQAYGLPQEVFVRPLMAMARTHHKDAKPIFCDFRSPLLVEMLADLFSKYRSARATEMLPSTDQCWIADDKGRYTFELRMFVRPKAG